MIPNNCSITVNPSQRIISLNNLHHLICHIKVDELKNNVDVKLTLLAFLVESDQIIKFKTSMYLRNSL